MPHERTIPPSPDWRAGAAWALDRAMNFCHKHESLGVLLDLRQLREALLSEVAVDDPDRCFPPGTRAFVAEDGDVVIYPPATAAPGSVPTVATRSTADEG